jgi:hypothetical protein
LIISIDSENAFDKIQHAFMTKTLIKLRIERIYLNIIKVIYGKLLANIILNRKNLKTFPLKSGMRKGCPLSSLLSNIIFQFLAKAIRQEYKVKRIQIGKEEVNVSLCTNGKFLYLKDSKTSTQKSC